MPNPDGSPTEAELKAKLEALRAELDALILQFDTLVVPTLPWRKQLELRIFDIGRSVADAVRMAHGLGPDDPWPPAPMPPELPPSGWWW